jgi:hypothetical protein
MPLIGSDILRWLTHGIGKDPTKIAWLDPDFEFGHSRREDEAAHWHAHDYFNPAARFDENNGWQWGPQQGDCYLVQRGGRWFPFHEFDYRTATDTWGIYNPDNDGGECIGIGPVTLQDGRVLQAAAIWHTRDSGAANAGGMFLACAENPTQPGWLLFGDDIDAAVHTVTIHIDTQPGMAPTGIWAATEVPAPTSYRRLSLALPTWIDGVFSTPTLDCILCDHFSADLKNCERFICVEDLGIVHWSPWQQIGTGVTIDATALCAPPIPGLAAPLAGMVMYACRHRMVYRRDPAGSQRGIDYAFPPANMMPLAGVGVPAPLPLPLPPPSPSPPAAAQAVTLRVRDSGGALVDALGPDGTVLATVRVTVGS